MGSIIWPVGVECKQTENKLLSPRRCHPGVGWVCPFRIIKKTPYRSDQRSCKLIPGIVVKLTTRIRKEACPFFILFMIYKIMTQENGDIYDLSPSHMDPVPQLGSVGQRA